MEGLLLLWIIVAAICGAIWSSKGKSFGVGLLLGALFGIFALLYGCVMRADEGVIAEDNVRRGLAQRCPACAEVVQNGARKCRFCGEDLSATARATG